MLNLVNELHSKAYTFMLCIQPERADIVVNSPNYTWYVSLLPHESFPKVRALADLPRIAALGSQSAGKSTLIESILGITLPRAAGTCTRYTDADGYVSNRHHELMARNLPLLDARPGAGSRDRKGVGNARSGCALRWMRMGRRWGKPRQGVH